MRQCDHKQLAKQSNRRYGAGGMRLKHAAHVCDFGRVEAQWLVEMRRILPKLDVSRRKGPHEHATLHIWPERA